MDRSWDVPAAHLSESLSDPLWMTAGVDNGDDNQHVFLQGVVNTEWESLGQGPMVAEGQFVDASVIAERFDIGDQATSEVVAQAGLLSFVEPVALGEIGFRIGGNADDHWPSFMRRALASAHVATVARPSSSLRDLSSRMSRCQSGDGTSPG